MLVTGIILIVIGLIGGVFAGILNMRSIMGCTKHPRNSHPNDWAFERRFSIKTLMIFGSFFGAVFVFGAILTIIALVQGVSGA